MVSYHFICSSTSAHHRLALGQIMLNGWRTLIACIILWLACSDGRDHLTIPKFLYCYKAVEMHSGWLYFTAWSPKRTLITGLPTSNRGWKKKIFFTSEDLLESFLWESLDDRIHIVPKI